MPNINLAAILQLLHARSVGDVLHLGLEALGGVAALWLFASQLVPRLTLWLLPWATRAGAIVALWLVTNPITGPVLRDPKNRERVKQLLHAIVDMIMKLATAFEVELDRDLDRGGEPAPSPAAAGGPQAPVPVPAGPAPTPPAPGGSAAPAAGA